jgi:hypothetical protein
MRRGERERFEEKWCPEPFSGCWLWTAGCASRGYGYFKAAGIMQYAHRVAWQLYRGLVPDGLLVLHSCDTTLCVNPAHLFLGTHGDNTRDAFSKGRQRAPVNPDPRGEKNGRAKLSASDVIGIRKSTDSCRKTAAKYPVGFGTIARIRSGQKWPHLVAV